MGVCGGTLVGAGCEERGVGGGGLVGKSVRRGAEKGSKWASGCRSSLRPPPFSFPAERGTSRVVSGAERSQQWHGSGCFVERVRGFLFLNKSVLLIWFSVAVPE